MDTFRKELLFKAILQHAGLTSKPKKNIFKLLPAIVGICAFMPSPVEVPFLGISNKKVCLVSVDSLPPRDIFPNGSIPKEVLFTEAWSEVLLKRFYNGGPCTVVSYTLVIAPKRQDIIARKCSEPFCPIEPEMQQKILLDGTIVYIEDIMIQCQGNSTPENIGGLACSRKRKATH